MGAELILDILLLDVEYLAAILSRNPELAVLHLDARTDGEQVGSERGNRRAAAALLHIFELVEHKARAGLFVQINGGLRYILRAHSLIAHLAGSYDLERDTGAQMARVDDINSVHSLRGESRVLMGRGYLGAQREMDNFLSLVDKGLEEGLIVAYRNSRGRRQLARLVVVPENIGSGYIYSVAV